MRRHAVLRRVGVMQRVAVLRRLVAMCAGLALPLLASAHAHLTAAEPADGSTLNAAPAQFILQFSEPALLTSLTVQAQGAKEAQKIAPLPASASAQIRIAAPPLAPGGWALRYRVLSADGHLVAGGIHFTIAAH
jgi:methionine-rich copper-binding protein CopC